MWDDDDNSWEGLYIRVETDDYVITREIKLPSVGIALQPSVVTTFNISLTEDNVSEFVQKGISIDKSEMELMPGDGKFVDLKAEVLSFPRNTIYSNTDFQEYFSVSPADFSLRYVEYGEIDYNSSDANSEYISHVYLSVDDEVEAGEYDVTITYDGQYSTTCRVSVITDSKKIVFTDPNVKEICVNTWGGHLYPEELTEYEASKVTTLRNPDNEWKSYFMGNTDIVSFDEFEYFTGMTGIDQSAFEGCSSLESIKLPKSITRIDDSNYSTGRAFRNCTSLSSVNLSACTALEMIGEHAFEGCSSLQTIMIPASVKYISSDAFRYCTALTTVTIPENSQLESLHGNGYYDSVNSSYKHGAFYGCQSLQSIWLPPTLKQIGEYAFSNCIALTSINIPNSVESLGSHAFDDCRALQHISIPGSVQTISQAAFYDCYNLSEVILHEGLKTIDREAFFCCTSLHELEFPASLTTIGYYRYESNVFYGVEFRSGTDDQGNEYHGVKFKGSTPPSFERADTKISGKHWDDTANDGAGAWVDGVNVYVPAGTKAAYEAINGVTDGGKNTVIEF